MTIKSAILILLSAGLASAAAEKYNLGVGVGNSHPFAEENFKTNASPGNSYHYWLGYRFSQSFGVELAHESLDFDQLNSSSKALNVSAVFNFAPYTKIYPFIKAGLGAVEHTFHSTLLDKKSGLALKADAGLNFDILKCFSFQLGLNYQLYEKMTDSLKNTQAFNPYLAVVFSFGGSDNEPTESAVVQKPSQSANKTVSPPVEKKDQDNDGIADTDDKCANTPANVKVNSFGCSMTEKVEIAINVKFAPGKAEITPETIGEVAKLADFMKKYKETSVLVSGHTDSSGSRKMNIAVSESRAHAVRSELIKLGVEANRVTAKGFGPDRPVADNKTKEGKTANRRVVAEIKTEVDSAK